MKQGTENPCVVGSIPTLGTIPWALLAPRPLLKIQSWRDCLSFLLLIILRSDYIGGSKIMQV